MKGYNLSNNTSNNSANSNSSNNNEKTNHVTVIEPNNGHNSETKKKGKVNYVPDNFSKNFSLQKKILER